MAKDPAFLFYPNDWLGGTLGMTFEEKGAYMELLMLQFNRGHMDGHMCGQVVGQIWDKIRSKFTQDEKGLWYNVRLEEEKEKRKSFTISRKNNLSGTNQYTKKDGHMDGHTTSRMEDENEDINVLNTKGVKIRNFSQPSFEEVKAYCIERKNQVDPNKWIDHYTSNGWMVGKNKMKDWKAAIRTWEKSNFGSVPAFTIPQRIEKASPPLYQSPK